MEGGTHGHKHISIRTHGLTFEVLCVYACALIRKKCLIKGDARRVVCEGHFLTLYSPSPLLQTLRSLCLPCHHPSLAPVRRVTCFFGGPVCLRFLSAAGSLWEALWPSTVTPVTWT